MCNKQLESCLNRVHSTTARKNLKCSLVMVRSHSTLTTVADSRFREVASMQAFMDGIQ